MSNVRLVHESSRYRRTIVGILLVLATLWHTYLSSPIDKDDLPPFAIGMSPYIVLAALVRWIRYPGVVALSGLVLLSTDVSAGCSALRSTSSTGGVALIIQPLFGLLVIIPITLVLALFLRHLDDGAD